MTVAYDGGDASTRRIVSGGTAEGQYDRHGWTADFSLDYTLPIAANRLIRPSLGASAIRVSHGRVAKTGSTAFALDVARSRDHAVFVDGAMTFSGDTAGGRPCSRICRSAHAIRSTGARRMHSPRSAAVTA